MLFDQLRFYSSTDQRKQEEHRGRRQEAAVRTSGGLHRELRPTKKTVQQCAPHLRPSEPAFLSEKTVSNWGENNTLQNVGSEASYR